MMEAETLMMIQRAAWQERSYELGMLDDLPCSSSTRFTSGTYTCTPSLLSGDKVSAEDQVTIEMEASTTSSVISE